MVIKLRTIVRRRLPRLALTRTERDRVCQDFGRADQEHGRPCRCPQRQEHLPPLLATSYSQSIAFALARSMLCSLIPSLQFVLSTALFPCRHEWEAHSGRGDGEEVFALLRFDDGEQRVRGRTDEVDLGAPCGSVPAALAVVVDLLEVVLVRPRWRRRRPAVEPSACIVSVDRTGQRQSYPRLVRELSVFDFWCDSPKKQTLYVYLLESAKVCGRSRDALSHVLFYADPIELLPLPVASPVLRERLLGRIAGLLRVADLVDHGRVR